MMLRVWKQLLSLYNNKLQNLKETTVWFYNYVQE